MPSDGSQALRSRGGPRGAVGPVIRGVARRVAGVQNSGRPSRRSRGADAAPEQLAPALEALAESIPIPRPGLGQSEQNGFTPEPVVVSEESEAPGICVPCLAGRLLVMAVLAGLTIYLIYRVRQENQKAADK